MPKGIMLTPEEQTQRRQEVANIAIHLFEKNGFQKTSMREIAAATNMGKSSLYDFFKTKDEILVYSVEIHMSHLIQKANNVVSTESSPLVCIKKILLNSLTYHEQYKGILMWLNEELTYLDAAYQKRLAAVRHIYRKVLQSVIDDGIDQGIFRKTDSALTARLLLNSMLSNVYTSQPTSSMEKMLDETMNIFLYGILEVKG